MVRVERRWRLLTCGLLKLGMMGWDGTGWQRSDGSGEDGDREAMEALVRIPIHCCRNLVATTWLLSFSCSLLTLALSHKTVA